MSSNDVQSKCVYPLPLILFALPSDHLSKKATKNWTEMGHIPLSLEKSRAAEHRTSCHLYPGFSSLFIFPFTAREDRCVQTPEAAVAPEHRCTRRPRRAKRTITLAKKTFINDELNAEPYPYLSVSYTRATLTTGEWRWEDVRCHALLAERQIWNQPRTAHEAQE
ncbi:hypothetical protein BC826DRAFT_1003178 [Russula brevipes]|nr:hypothetical protein BC826DRAFT_1003178 [Russula brevipes]